jgi:hypothetical protein
VLKNSGKPSSGCYTVYDPVLLLRLKPVADETKITTVKSII